MTDTFDIKKLKKIRMQDLKNFAGSSVFNRGEKYSIQGRVDEVFISPKGIIAKVRGTKPYITQVWTTKSGALKSRCTCPYGASCKHAVATVFEYWKDKDIVEEISEDHQYILRLERLYDSDNYYNDWDAETFEQDLKMQKSDVQNKLKSFLGKKSKTDLTELVLKIADQNARVREELFDQINLSSGDHSKITKEIKAEIRGIFLEPAWYNHWSGEGNLADFSRVRKKMNFLYDKKQYNALIEILWVFIDEADEYIEQCNDEGESQRDIQECVSIGINAIEKSSMDDSEKLILAVTTVMYDNFGTFSDFHELLQKKYPKQAWVDLSEKLVKTLDEMSTTKDSFSSRYRRDRISDFVILAYENLGEKEKVLELCDEEAFLNGNRIRYVKKLVEYKKFELAEKEANIALGESKRDRFHGHTNELKQILEVLAVRKGDNETILLIKQESFLEEYSLDSYKELLKIAKKMKVHDEIRHWALDYLHKGKAKKVGALKKSFQAKKSSWVNFPHFKSLIQIAYYEKRVEDIYHFYILIKKKYPKQRNEVKGLVSTYLKKDYPEVSIEIWKERVLSIIDARQPNRYADSVEYFNEIKKAYQKQNKINEWKDYLLEIRSEFARLPRFIKETSHLK